ncbi:MAG TPA: 16S rRNA (guanine(527)-N(7))-methyltransferase RsmG [Clostridiales bacterium]|nr:16S rRNA (guanine(527)-N(7))-methyltransferase RsmG [Clostridiales bacterium]
MNEGYKKFEDGLRQLNIVLNQDQKEQFLKYYELLIEWNKVMNLTAITDFTEVIDKHFLDSLTMIKIYSLSNEKIIDVGTGAGFPGIPLKIAFPNTKIVLLDSLRKRINFLDEVIKSLRLDGIETIHGRAEDLGKDTKYREKFDVCTSRAVANLATLAEYCLPFVKVGGNFISYKSGDVTEELNLAKKATGLLGGSIDEIKIFPLPGTDIDRSLIKIKKDSRTPMKFPRTPGKPSKEPLL